MNEPSRMNVKINIPSQQTNRPKASRLLTLDRIIEHIKIQGLDEYTTKGLIDLASNYPTAALPSFRKNFNLMIQRVRAKRKLEQRGEENVEVREITEVAKREEITESKEPIGFENAFKQAFKEEEK